MRHSHQLVVATWIPYQLLVYGARTGAGDSIMDVAFLSAISALAGSVVGGVTSLAASWLTQHVQYRAQRHASELNKREELYRNFIEEASRWYADALTHDKPEVSNLVNLYALVSRMRVLSSPGVVESADRAVIAIIDAYLAPNKGFPDVKELLKADAVNPLREFSNACREEMRGNLGPIAR